ncbi:MAG: PAS domain S-box protein [Candidatus Zixiibacteriota bacterium]|nr:MAG: PAS domain S-box protein [candidate division Zixibacteria bacterium]
MNDRAEEIRRLKDSEEKYRKMVELANDAIFGIDVDSGGILYANPKAEKMCGYSCDTLTGMKAWELHPPEEQESARKLFAEVVEEGSSYRRDMHFAREDGSRIIVDVSAVVTSCGEKKIIQRICRDVTERRQLEDELKQLNKDLEIRIEQRTRELNRKQMQLAQSEKMAALGNLVAGIAHEINTPLGALNSNNDVFIRLVARLKAALDELKGCDELRDNPELETIFENIEKLNDVSRTAADRIVNIVSSLRKFARLDRSEKDTVDIHEGLETTLTLAQHELKNRVEVIREYGDIPMIDCYPNQLNQAFLNLLVNASQAIEGQGKIWIRTLQKDNNVIVEIRDSGRGIPPENLSKVFDPGFTTKGSGVGTGLGLSIVHQIIQDHGGNIELESELNKGTTFRVILPINGGEKS